MGDGDNVAIVNEGIERLWVKIASFESRSL